MEPGVLENSGRNVAPHILMVTHVIPYPPAAGNEIRIFNMLKWFRRKEYRVTLVVRPLGNEEVSNESVIGLHKFVDDLYVFDARAKPDSSAEMIGSRVLDPDFQNDRVAELQNGFCPPWFVSDVANLIQQKRPDVLLAEYVVMSRVLNVPEATGCLKVIDSIELFCRLKVTLEKFGLVNYGLDLSDEEEKLLLERADIILAIQHLEYSEIQKLVPDRRALVTGFDLDIRSGEEQHNVAGRVLIIGSENEFNVRGTQDFIDYTWPLILEQYPSATLHVVGRVSRCVHTNDPSVSLLGFVDSLESEYDQASVVVNPCRVGTGLKIKTVEALACGKPHVGWPASSDGLRELGELPYVVAGDAVDFADAIGEFLSDPGKCRNYGAKAQKFISSHFGAEVVYGPLSAAIEEHVSSRH